MNTIQLFQHSYVTLAFFCTDKLLEQAKQHLIQDAKFPLRLPIQTDLLVRFVLCFLCELGINLMKEVFDDIQRQQTLTKNQPAEKNAQLVRNVKPTHKGHSTDNQAHTISSMHTPF